jgi:hypothetical protein
MTKVPLTVFVKQTRASERNEALSIWVLVI